jgi:hypothetical protein
MRVVYTHTDAYGYPMSLNSPAPAGRLNDMNPSRYQYPQGAIFISSRQTDDFGVILRSV